MASIRAGHYLTKDQTMLMSEFTSGARYFLMRFFLPVIGGLSILMLILGGVVRLTESADTPSGGPADPAANTDIARRQATNAAWAPVDGIDYATELTAGESMIIDRLDAIALRLDTIDYAVKDNLREHETLNMLAWSLGSRYKDYLADMGRDGME